MTVGTELEDRKMKIRYNTEKKQTEKQKRKLKGQTMS